MSEEELAILLETFLRLPSFLPVSFRAVLLQPEQLQLLHFSVAAPFLPHALHICSPEAASSCEEGVPTHPLCKHLARSLCKWMASTIFPRTIECISGLSGDHLKDKLKAWNEKIPQLLATLQELMQQVNLHLQVQEPLFSQLRENMSDTVYTLVEDYSISRGAPTMKTQSSIADGNSILLNNVSLHKVQLKPTCMLLDTRKVLTLVLHDQDGTNAVRTGVLLVRDLCKEINVSVTAMQLLYMPESKQPLKIVEKILEVLNIEGVKALLGFRSTIGSITEALPPARSLLLASFLEANGIDVAGAKLTTGGRALSKHVHRSSSGWWGVFSGNDEKKNELALNRITYLIQHACWLNVHHMPPNSYVFEIRVKEGYGARWSADGTKDKENETNMEKCSKRQNASKGKMATWHNDLQAKGYRDPIPAPSLVVQATLAMMEASHIHEEILSIDNKAVEEVSGISGTTNDGWSCKEVEALSHILCQLRCMKGFSKTTFLRMILLFYTLVIALAFRGVFDLST